MLINKPWKNLKEFRSSLSSQCYRFTDETQPHFEIKRNALQFVANLKGNSAVDYLEFGVFRGSTFRFAQQTFIEGSRFWGFDTFNGLPEEWVTSMPLHRRYNSKDYRPTSTQSFNNFDLGGQLPDPGIGELIPGLFQETLQPFVNRFKRRNPLVVLIDCDLYSSTLYILCRLHHLLKAGDVIIFDEFGDENNEFQAFNDYLSSHYNRQQFHCIYWDDVDGLVTAFEYT
jgi:O-methyltransferase